MQPFKIGKSYICCHRLNPNDPQNMMLVVTDNNGLKVSLQFCTACYATWAGNGDLYRSYVKDGNRTADEFVSKELGLI